MDIEKETKKHWDKIRERGFAGFTKQADKYDKWKTTDTEYEKMSEESDKIEGIKDEIVEKVESIPLYKILIVKGVIKPIETYREQDSHDDPGQFYKSFFSDLEELSNDLENFMEQIEKATFGIPMDLENLYEEQSPDPEDYDW